MIHTASFTYRETNVDDDSRLRQDNIHAAHKCPPACTEAAALCHQPGSCRTFHTFREQYRHPGLGRLQGGHEAVRARDAADRREGHRTDDKHNRYNLGPNGGILTSLNLFATKIDQILGLLEKRTKPNPEKPNAKPIKNILVDTPGQIEVFVWSASGSILLDSLASSFPTVIAYIIDTPRTSSTSTFMSNMLYACSILYKTKLPMILVFNKTDVKDAEFAKKWMTDFEAFQAALREEEDSGDGPAGGSGYMGSLLNSMSLMLEEFYRHLSVVGVSAMTGQGIDDFFVAVGQKAEEFEADYRPELERRQQERAKAKDGQKEKELGRLLKDMKVSGQGSSRSSGRKEPETISDIEDEDEDGEDDIPADLVDPDEEGDDDDDEQDEEGDAGLKKKYKDALRDDAAGANASAAAEDSFLRYLHASGGR